MTPLPRAARRPGKYNPGGGVAVATARLRALKAARRKRICIKGKRG